MKQTSTIATAAFKKYLVLLLTILSFALSYSVSAQFNCTCTGTNIVLNPSFENGTTSWSSSGGTLAAGNGGVACGSFSGDLNNTSTSSKAWQLIGTDLASGTVINTSVYAGTHDNTFNNWVAVEFLDAANVVLGTSVYIQVDKILANTPAGPQLYTFAATVPAGAKYTRVAFGGNGSYTKTDRWCVTSTPPVNLQLGNRVWNDANKNGINETTEVGIGNVTVNLYRDNDNNNYPDTTAAGLPNVIATTLTDAGGNYTFNNLAAGNYIVGVITPSGFVRDSINGGDPDDNINLDNNGVYAINGGETLGWAITLAAGTEPNGSNTNTNYNDTYDFGFSSASTSSTYCSGTLLTNSNGYYGGFEIIPHNLNLGPVSNPNPAGSELTLITSGNISADKAIIASNGNAIPGGITVAPHSGNWLLLLHPKTNNERLWFKTVSVTAGTTYNFCAWGAGSKQDPATMTLKLYMNGVNVASGTITNAGVWTQVCGSYTVPAGVTSMEISIQDPTAGAGGPSHFIALDDICFSPGAVLGSIGDRVWLDANGNGIQDATETGGITGVTVQLRNSTNTVIATTTTNASGNYLFTGLAAGTYTVVFPVSISGAVVTTANVGADDNIDSDPSQTTGITANIVLASGQNIVNVDAGYCPVNLQLGNRVWYDTNNNGISESSENGIRNVTVNLYKDDNNDNVADGAALATQLTDANGNYLFSNLAPGNYIVGAVIPAGYVSSAVNGGDPDNNIDLDDNGQVAVGTEIRGLAITLTGGAEPTSGNTNNTYDFGLLPDCNCTTSTSNLLVNGNFENGTTGWSWSGGTLTTGTGYIACGAANGFNNWSAGTSKVWQDVTIAAASTVTFKAFAGTHTPGITCSPTLSLIFLDAANTVLGQSNVTVTRDVDINNSQIEQYSITAVAPVGTTKVRVQSSITCNAMKLDAFCLNVTPPLTLGNRVWNDANKNGINETTEAGIGNVTVNLYRDNDNNNYPDTTAAGLPNVIATTLTDASGNYTFSNLIAGNYIVGVVNPAGFIRDSINGGDPDNNINLDNNGVYAINGGETLGWAITLAAGTEPNAGNTNTNYNDTYDFGFYTTSTTPTYCTGTLLTNSNGYYGGFEIIPYNLNLGPVSNPNPAGSELTLIASGNISADKAIIASNGNAIPGGITVYPHSGNWLLLLHPKTNNERLWFKTVSVTPGFTYNFCAWGAGSKQDPAAMTLKLYMNGVNVGTGTITNGGVWTEVCGSYTVPAGVTSMEISIQDPTAGDGGPSHFIALDDICFSATSIPGSIGDRVWNDTNGNGIQDAGEVGIAGVTVVLLNAAGQPIATTTTDAFGNYKFSGLPAGNYSVRITPPANYSLSPKTQGGDINLDSDFDPITYTTGTVTLANGQNRTDIDAGLKFSQPLPASVGDRVWLDTNGNGVQDAGEPGVSNVLVTLYNSSNVAVRYTYTDVNGNYLFTDVAAGAYTVGVSLPPAFVFTTNSGAVSGTTNSDIVPATGRTASFTVNAGDQITYVDAGIKTQSSLNGSVGDFVWNDINKNGIQQVGEPGIEGVTVRLLNATTNAIIATTTTDATGKYIFNDVPAGNYKVEFVTPGGYTTTTKLNSDVAASGTDSDVDPATSKTETFTLLQGQRITSVDAGYFLTTGPGTGRIGDRVWLDANQNGIQDAGELSVQGITVTLFDATNTAIKTTVTNAGGNYLFTDLAAGNYTVGFSNIPAGYTFTTQGLGTAATGSDANPATGRTGTITLAAGQTNLDVDAGIRSSMAGTASIGNRVWSDLSNNGLQDAGEPGIEGVTVELLDAAGNPIDKDPNTAGVQPTITVTNALGEYLFTGLAAGDYKVRFSTLPAGYNASPKGAGTDRNIDSDGNTVTAGTSTTDVVSVAVGEERLDIDFGLFNPTAPLGQLGDRVWFDANNNGLQDATEQGVPGVTVSLLNAANAVVATTVTDANGLYNFVNLAAGTYSVKFSNLPAGFTFAPANQGANDAIDSDADAVTGITGTYTIAAGTVNTTVDAGIYSTRAALGDYVWFDANSDGIQDATERGITGVTVTLYDATNTAVTSAITDQTGRYFFSNLNPGTYTVGFNTIPAKLAFTLKDVVAAGDAADSDVDPATGRTAAVTLVAGQVNLTVDAGLKPFVPASVGDYVWLDLDRDGIQDAFEPGVPGILVTLYNSANQPIGSAITDGNGYYLISNVPAGTGYYVVFSNRPDVTAPWTLQNVGGVAAINNSKADATGKTLPFNVAEGQVISNIDAGLYKKINISGHVWIDQDLINPGGVDKDIPAGSSISLPNNLLVYLIDNATGQVVDIQGIQNDAFTFLNVTPNRGYRIQVSQVGYNIGDILPNNPAINQDYLPVPFLNTGEWLGPEVDQKDGNPNGELFVPVLFEDVKNANFGLFTNSGAVVTG